MRRSSFRIEEITQVALELAEKKGVGGVTTAALARELGFTEAALYRHFPGKSAILAAALRHLGEHVLATMLLELNPDDPRSRADARRQLDRHIQRFASGGGLLLQFLLHAVTSRGPDLQKAGNGFLIEYLERMEHHFTALQSRDLAGAEISPNELARVWLCQLLGGFVRSRLTGEAWDPVDQPGYQAFIQQLTSPTEVTV